MSMKSGGRQVVVPGSYLFASLPDPTLTPQMFCWCSDGIAGGCFMLSNGVIWEPTVQTPYVLLIGGPTNRTMALATALQATDPTRAALFTINLTGTATLTLAAGVTCSANVVMGPTAAVASGTGTTIGKWANGLTGTLIVGLNINVPQATPMTMMLPIGWFIAVISTGTGAVTITSAFDQSIG